MMRHYFMKHSPEVHTTQQCHSRCHQQSVKLWLQGDRWPHYERPVWPSPMWPTHQASVQPSHHCQHDAPEALRQCMLASCWQHSHELVEGAEGLAQVELDGQASQVTQVRSKRRIVERVIPGTTHSSITLSGEQVYQVSSSPDHHHTSHLAPHQ